MKCGVGELVSVCNGGAERTWPWWDSSKKWDCLQWHIMKCNDRNRNWDDSSINHQ